MADTVAPLKVLNSTGRKAAVSALQPGLSIGGLASVSAVLFLITFIAVRLSGLFLDLPWGMIGLFTLAGLPFSCCLHWLAQWEASRHAAVKWPACLAISAAILLGNQYWAVWPLLACLLAALPGAKFRLKQAGTLLSAFVVLVCGYGVVWNLNFLLMRYMSLHRWDPYLRALDVSIYSLFLGDGVDLNSMFPLVSHPLLLRLFDNAYAILIPEVILLAVLFSQRRDPRAITDYLRWLFGLYLVGILTYACFPVNGPHLYYPEQQDLARSLPTTVAMAEGMMHDYQVAKVGGQLTGFGYFIAVPSLHVLASIFLQHSLRSFPVLFRLFLPVNVALCLSTVVLGYHYIFDFFAAVAVYLVLIGVARARNRIPVHFDRPEEASSNGMTPPL